MSRINGDKARFHRGRKKKIAKRQRTRDLLKLDQNSKSSTPGAASKSRQVKM